MGYCLRKFHIRCKGSNLQHLTYTFGCFFPVQYLGRMNIFRRPSLCKMNTIIGIPCTDIPVFYDETVPAVIETPQEIRIFINGFLLHKLRRNAFPVIVRVAAEPQNSVDFLLRKGQSERCMFYTFRFVDGFNLFRFGGDQVKQTELISSAKGCGFV